MADRNVLILFKPGISVMVQSILAMRIHMNWSESNRVTTDDHVDRMAVWGDPDDLTEYWIQSLNKCPYMVALETSGFLPDDLYYKFNLEYAMKDGAGRPSIRFKNMEDVALARMFCPEMPEDLNWAVAIEDMMSEAGEYKFLSISPALGEGYLDLAEKILRIYPTWEGHKRHLDSDRLIEYEEEGEVAED